MAFDAYDDYEQSERVQKWLRQNGLSIVVGIVIGLIGIFGYQQWRNHQVSHQAAASGIYQQLQAVIDSGNTAASDSLVQQLMNDYAESPYALFAVSDRARRQVEAKDYDKALDSLAWAEQHASSRRNSAAMCWSSLGVQTMRERLIRPPVGAERAGRNAVRCK
jgi:predicted negative regulator of RcsB-dependent stress response